MEDHIEEAISQAEQGVYEKTQTEAESALVLAHKLRDEEIIGKSERIISYAIMVIYGNELFDAGRYDMALESYLYSLSIANNIDDLTTELLERAIAKTEMHIAFFTLMDNADDLASNFELEEALFVYEEALQVATALSFAEGIDLAETGIEEMQYRIILAKRMEADNLLLKGELHYGDEQFAEALIFFYEALDILIELDDHLSIFYTESRISHTEQKLLEIELADVDTPGTETSDTEPPTGLPTPPPPTPPPPDDIDKQDEISSNFEHNSSLDFDLKTLIDNQHRRPANQIRMGSREGMNEGWYNGCGWVAVYNSLILLGNPKHPAEIVKHFEESGGTVWGGVFGTYPNAIEDYLKSLGYSVNHTLFPQLTKDIDEEIRNSRVSILAYAHTSAAHYITIEYSEDEDIFIVYNDGFARTRSSALGLSNTTSVGAAIDSVAALIGGTRDILFSFSLIVVN